MTAESINTMPATMTGSWVFSGGKFRFETPWMSLPIDARYLIGFDPSEWERQLNRLGRSAYLANSAALVRVQGVDTSRYQVNLTEDDTDPLVFTLINPPVAE